MKPKKFMLMLLLLAYYTVVVAVGVATATTMSYQDSYTEFPGQETWWNEVDVIYSPEVESSSITWDEFSGKLIEIRINFDPNNKDFYGFTSLFINIGDHTGNNYGYDSWDFFIHSGGTSDSATTIGDIPTDGLWAVKENYQYTRAGGLVERTNHPNGIDEASMLFVSPLVPIWDGDSLVYDFNSYSLGVYISSGYSFAWTLKCANEVTLAFDERSEVPEPVTMVLFGAGMVGVGLFLRKR